MFDQALILLQNITLINNILLLGFIIIFTVIFWREHRNSNSPVSFTDLIVDPKTNKVSNTKLGQFFGIAFSSWVIIFLAQKVEASQVAGLFPWLFGTWLTFLATSTGIKQFIGSKDKVEMTTKE